MTGKRRPTFNPEFKLESAQLVVDQNYSVRQAAEAVNVSASAMEDIYGHPHGETYMETYMADIYGQTYIRHIWTPTRI